MSLRSALMTAAREGMRACAPSGKGDHNTAPAAARRSYARTARRTIRYPMRDKDRFRPEQAECLVDGRAHPVANLSLGGFFVIAEAPLPVGQTVALRLTVDGRAMDVVA